MVALGDRRFVVELIKPSHYDDDGYVIQWWTARYPKLYRVRPRIDGGAAAISALSSAIDKSGANLAEQTGRRDVWHRDYGSARWSLQ